jgi:hypothetical protein
VAKSEVLTATVWWTGGNESTTFCEFELDETSAQHGQNTLEFASCAIRMAIVYSHRIPRITEPVVTPLRFVVAKEGKKT